ncbi:MAG: D-amino acid dehydrogenase [Aquisalimonadaceae bacterium]
MRVIVIGAGVIGTTTAWFLAQHGHEVTLLDRGPGVGLETSFANGGLLHASHAEPWNAPGVIWQLLRWIGRENSPLLVRPGQLPRLAGWGLGFLRYSRRRRFEHSTRLNSQLAVYSLEMLRTLRRETGIRYDGQQNGILKIFREQASQDKALRASAFMEELGVRHAMLDPRQTIALEPALADIGHELIGSLYYPDDESGDAHLFTARLAELARGQGVSVETDTPVNRLVRQGDHIKYLEIPGGRLSAERYVLAAGCQSPILARQAGIRLPIYPVKGYSATLPVDGWSNPPAIPVIDDANKVVLSMLGSRVRIAGTAEFAGYDLTLREHRARSVLEQMLKTFPSLEQHVRDDRMEYWCGLRPMTMDGPPILGASPLTNLYLNCGPGHLGWTFACGAGKLVADMISGKPTALNMEGYSVARY